MLASHSAGMKAALMAVSRAVDSVSKMATTSVDEMVAVSGKKMGNAKAASSVEKLEEI